MSNTRRQLPHRFEPLHLAQGRFDALALLDLVAATGGCGGKLRGPLLHTQFEFLVRAGGLHIAAGGRAGRFARR